MAAAPAVTTTITTASAIKPGMYIELSTTRLLIKPIEHSEAADVAAMVTENISRWTSQVPWPYSTDDALSWLHSTPLWERLGIYSEGKLVGTIRMPLSDDDELGFFIAEEHQGKGYVTEAAQALIAFAFDSTGLNFMLSYCHPENAASIRVHEKLGFKKLKETMRYWPNKQREIPVILWRLEKA
jgi:RimJ/RimL family protein N-acetyltransferase